MYRKFLTFAAVFLLVFLFAAVSGAQKKIPKVDQFYILMDASGSMGEKYGETGTKKAALARDLIQSMNSKIPELDYKGSLYTLGPLNKIHPLSFYDRSAMSRKIATLPGNISRWFGNPTPLGRDMKKLDEKIAAGKKKTAVIIFSDGGSNVGESPVKVARSMDTAYPDTFCFYTVSLADRAHWEKRLKAIAEVNSCSRLVRASSLTDESAMSSLVREIFFTYAPDSDGDGVYDENDRCPGTSSGIQVDARGCPLDDDGDGVANYKDDCPGTPSGVRVDAEGCALDDDGDGVANYKDDCPGTSAGVEVDAKGCKKPEDVVISAAEGEVLFAVDKAVINPKYKKYIDKVADLLSENPRYMAMVEGYTDNTGPASYNHKLSEKRAQSVKDYLKSQGIAAKRISTVGMGEENPVADNDTAEGRRKNRRVVVEILVP